MKNFIIASLLMLSVFLGWSTSHAQQQPGIPILLYHHIASNTTEHNWLLEHIGPTVVHIDVFRQQMRWLKNNGYRTLRLRELIAIMEGRQALPPKAVMIMFDDGWLSSLQAVSIFRRLNIHATWAPLTNPGWQGWELFYMMADDILFLDRHRTGFDIVAHTIDHPDLGELLAQGNYTEVYRQLEESKYTLEAYVGHTINGFAWPFGVYNDELVDIASNPVNQVNYKYLFTVVPGLNLPGDDVRYIKRSTIDGRCPLSTFIQTVQTGAEVFCD